MHHVHQVTTEFLSEILQILDDYSQTKAAKVEIFHGTLRQFFCTHNHDELGEKNAASVCSLLLWSLAAIAIFTRPASFSPLAAVFLSRFSSSALPQSKFLKLPSTFRPLSLKESIVAPHSLLQETVGQAEPGLHSIRQRQDARVREHRHVL